MRLMKALMILIISTTPVLFTPARRHAYCGSATIASSLRFIASFMLWACFGLILFVKLYRIAAFACLLSMLAFAAVRCR